MSSTPPFYIGYADGTNRSSQNATLAAWVIFNLSNVFLDSEGIFLGCATNNLVEYETIIALMTNAYALGICSLVVWLDSKLVISQLTSRYYVLYPMLY